MRYTNQRIRFVDDHEDMNQILPATTIGNDRVQLFSFLVGFLQIVTGANRD